MKKKTENKYLLIFVPTLPAFFLLALITPLPVLPSH